MPENIFSRDEALIALRAMSDNLAALTNEMMAQRTLVGDLREDIATIKARQETVLELKESLKEAFTRIKDLENRGFQQDGAMNLAKLLKDFGPWVAALATLAWGFFTRKPI